MPCSLSRRNSKSRRIATSAPTRSSNSAASNLRPTAPDRCAGSWFGMRINQREIVLLTNLLDFGATTIAAIYKERWHIELFFKALKQNLTVKSFVGTSENALRIQIW